MNNEYVKLSQQGSNFASLKQIMHSKFGICRKTDYSQLK